MSAVRRIARNTAILIATQVVVAAFGLVYGIYAARHLGPDSFGILTFAIALASLGTMLFGAGIGPLILREVSADRSAAPRYLANGGLLRLVMAAISLVVIGLYAYFMDYPSETVLVVFLLGLAMAFKAVTEVPYSVFRAYEMMQYIAVGQILTSLLLLVGLAFALVFDFSVIGFAWIYVIANAVSLVYVIAMLIRRFMISGQGPHIPRDAFRVDLKSMRSIQSAAVPFALVTVGAASLHYTDSVMLSAMVPDSDALVGWYNAAYRLIDTLTMFRAAVVVSVTPSLVQAFISYRHILRFMCERLFKYYLIVALPIGIGTTLLAERFVLTIYGREYLESAVALQVLIWSFVLVSTNFVMTLFQATQRQRAAAAVIVSNAIINVLLNLWVIPRYDYVGAAATTVGASAIGLITFFVLYSRTEYYFGLAYVLKLLARVMPAAAAMGLLIWFLPQLHLAFLVPLAAIVYFAVLALVRAFDAQDSDMIRSLITGRPLSTTAATEDTKNGPRAE